MLLIIVIIIRNLGVTLLLALCLLPQSLIFLIQSLSLLSRKINEFVEGDFDPQSDKQQISLIQLV